MPTIKKEKIIYYYFNYLTCFVCLMGGKQPALVNRSVFTYLTVVKISEPSEIQT